MNNSMSVLIIGYVWPEPNSSAAGSRMMQLITAMRNQDWDIIFASPAQHSEHAVDLEALGIRKKNIELNNVSFDEYINELNPDIVIFDRFMMEEQFGWRVEKFSPNSLRILNTEDLHSLRDARQTAIKKSDDFHISNPDHLVQYLHNDLAIREIAAILRSDLTLMISPVEISLLIEHFQVPDQQVMYLPFMLNSIHENDISMLPKFNDRAHFISIGNFRHAPNWDVVLYLKQKIWPLIRKKIPHAQLHIYGAYPPPKATQLHNKQQGFLVKGWAEDANKVIKNARVLLAPIRFGAGIKGKLTDAMICGTPSITTQIGAEGMLPVRGEDEQKWNGEIIALHEMMENPSVFADAAIEAYQNECNYAQLQHSGFKIINQQYNQSHWQKLFIDHLLLQKQRLTSLRKSNFLGLMLRHHSMKSTQYMAQWIEAKNAKE